MLTGVAIANLSAGDETLIAGEFPTLVIAPRHRDVSVQELRASEWGRPDFDLWAFDARMDETSAEPFVLSLIGDGSGPSFPVQVLNRCQRLIGRRNHASSTVEFSSALQMHRQMHDLTKPLVLADYRHSLDVWQWVLRLAPDATMEVQVAALFHDVERLLSESDERIEQRALDYQRFKDAHASGGAAMAARVLDEAGLSEDLRLRVAALIAAHERVSDDPELMLLNDADALSFFSLNSPGYLDYFGAEQTRKKITYTWERMSRAARERMALVGLRGDVARLYRDARLL
ncbi:MAG TPA: DUF4202 family protein [Thermoanaerobaculia bacterium]